jgi:hypothetical protein
MAAHQRRKEAARPNGHPAPPSPFATSAPDASPRSANPSVIQSQHVLTSKGRGMGAVNRLRQPAPCRQQSAMHSNRLVAMAGA